MCLNMVKRERLEFKLKCEMRHKIMNGIVGYSKVRTPVSCVCGRFHQMAIVAFI